MSVSIRRDDKCKSCGSSNAHMHNCDRKGKRIPGFLCFQCWREINPVMNPPKRNYRSLAYMGAVCLIFWVVLAYLIWTAYYG